jgi:uncharacterized glyoxalase superfamily protein PhnB
MPHHDHTSAAQAAITAPVSRTLAVADLGRSVAFYRDVLGFVVGAVHAGAGVASTTELTRGQARILLHEGDRSTDSTWEERPRGAAIVFFETDDVAAMHDAIRARGGVPSEFEKVNWIKMHMFQLQDPDGHTIWFGQSYHVPGPKSQGDSYAEMRVPAGRGQLRAINPVMPLSNVAAGVAYYRDVLGFSVNYAQHDLGVMDRDEVRILLAARTEKQTGIGSCYVYVRDADALHAELRARGANVQGEPVSHPWGLRDFKVLDLEGNEIAFGQTFE